MHVATKDISAFIIGTVLFRYVLLNWIGALLRALLKKMLIKTEHDLIVWTHYESRALRKGHAPKRPAACQDNNCAFIG